MRKLKLLMMTVCALMGAGQTWAQWTDVTSTYIANPSFELGTTGTPAASAKSGAFDAPYSWTATDMPTSGTHNFGNFKNDGNTPSNFGTTVTPSDGTYYYLARHSWATKLTTKLTQTSQSELPSGYYYLTIDYKIAKTSGDLNPKGYLSLGAKSGETTLGTLNSAISASQNTTYFNTADWTTMRVPFYVSSAGSVDFVITFNFNPQAANVPQEAIIIDNVRLLKADYHATPVANNTTDLYFYNEKTQQYLSAGQTWGTHATVDSYGYEITAALSNGVYTLATQQYNKYLGGLYMDADAVNWLFLETEASSGKYYMTQDGVNYMTSNGAGAELINVTTPTDASVWSIISKADRKSALSSATIANPVDATFLIADANFSRNVTSSVWNGTSKTSDNKTNLNLAGGNNENMCAESYHATFSVNQTLTGLHAGVYGLTAQGFYRQDGSDSEHLPYFYLGTETATFPVKTGSENSMANASTSFSAGLYTIDPIYVRIEADGSIELGAKLEGENYNLWCIWDNFQLKYYGDVTVAAVKMKASVDAYNAAKGEAEAFTEESMFAEDWTALQGAITSNTLDLNDPSLTESALTTATNNLVAAKAAATIAVAKKTTYDTAVSTINGGTNVDLTSLLTNPGFELGNTSGWTNDGSITANAQNNTAFDNKQGTWYAERWHAAGTIDINQTIAVLPAGIYQIDAYMYSDTGDAKLYANTENVSVTTSGKYSAVIEIADKGSIKMGASCTLTASTWLCLDDFKLTYLGTINDLTYTLATGKMGTDKSAAQSTAETTFIGNKTLANYNALLAAIAEAEASVAHYATLKTAIDKANDVIDANNFVTADATTAFQNEINDATDGWTDVTFTDAEATAEIAALGSAVSGHRGNATGKAGTFMVSAWDTHTDGETAGEWNGYYINTWSTEGDNDGSGFSVPFLEYWVSDTNNLPAKTMTATLTDLPNGCYEIEMWARVQRRSDADFNKDNSMITMNVNGGEKVSIMSNTSNNVGTGGSTMRLGRYTARGMVTDGTLTLTIDVKLGANVHWLSWRDITYTKIAGENESVTVSDAGFATYVSPAALDFTSTTIKAYKVKVNEKGKATLTQVEQVPANTPVLLYKKGGATEDIPVIASASTVSGNDLVAGKGAAVATYETVSTTNDYTNMILNNVSGIGFYFANGQTVATDRAYLHIASSLAPDAEGPGSRMVMVFADETTGVNDVRSKMSEVRGTYYNLNGQRVEKPAKGLYIVNGKKVIIK